MRELIAISGKQFSGKDMFTDFLIDACPNYMKMPIARAIKNEFAQLYHLTPDDIEAQKATYRSALIALGQRRRLKNPDYWIEQVMKTPGPKIISDMRLKHEYDFFKAHGAFCIRIEADREVRANRGRLVAESDPTECELDNVTGWDAIIINDSSPEELRQKAQDIAQMLCLDASKKA